MMQLTAIDAVLLGLYGLAEACTLLLISYMWAAPKLKIWPVYVAYDLVASATIFVFCGLGYYQTHIYFRVWWISQMAGYILLALLCIEILTLILPKFNRLVVAYGIATGVIMLSMIYNGMPPYRTADLMPISFNCVRICSFLLLVGVVMKKDWVWPYPGIAVGIMIKMVNMLVWGHLYQYSANHGWKNLLQIRYLYEVVAVLTMLTWTMCAWWPVRAPWKRPYYEKA